MPVFVENKDMVLNDQGGSSISVDNKSPTLRAEAHGNMPCVVESRIRRLTPLECERLQGLPDNWTDVPSVDHKGNIKPASDSSRYKAIGNGMAQPCADFVLSKVVQALRC